MKRTTLLSLPLAMIFGSCNGQGQHTEQKIETTENLVVDSVTSYIVSDCRIDTTGMTIKTRYLQADSSFQRIAGDGFTDYLLDLPLHPAHYVTHLYDGTEKWHKVQIGVIDMDIDPVDLQQCADAAMRLRGEYLYAAKLYEPLHFNFTNGFKCDFKTWASGKRIAIKGNRTWWINGGKTDDFSYNNFRAYMLQVFSYAGSYSLSKEMKHISLSDVRGGDCLVHGGTPGHVVMVIDAWRNEQTGDVKLMLAQSYMPAQEIEILDFGGTPYVVVAPDQQKIETPEWDFYASEFMRFGDN